MAGRRIELPLAALVLVGGYGTRLRPLTLYRSKPLVEFCNRPMVEYMLDALVDVGVGKIILALSEVQEDLTAYITGYQDKHPGVAIIPSLETTPMGTAGPIALAKEHLIGHRFFMLNSDVISPYPFRDLLAFHLEKGGEGTIMSWDVTDPTRFGVIVSDPTSLITKFVEKPNSLKFGTSINAGHYIFEPSVIARIPPVRTSIEVDIFPKMARDKQLYVMKLSGFWMDIGTPQSFIDCLPVFLTNDEKVLIDPTAKLGLECNIGPNVVIGPNVTIGNCCFIRNAVIMEGSTVGEATFIENSVLGWNAKIGNWVHISDMCTFGLDVTVRNGVVLKGVICCPHKVIDRSRWKPETII
jgi:mannose-1-phosphate guanylyltransferase